MLQPMLVIIMSLSEPCIFILGSFVIILTFWVRSYPKYFDEISIINELGMSLTGSGWYTIDASCQ